MPDELPMIGACALDATGFAAQRDRYGALGEHALGVEREGDRLTVRFDAHVDASLVEETVEIERGCCPFFALEWDAPSRRLTVAVAEAGQRPALDAIAYALGVGRATGDPPPAASVSRRVHSPGRVRRLRHP